MERGLTWANAEERLAGYAAMVRRYAPRLNLVAAADLERFEERHVDDSLRLAPLVSTAPGGPCIDVGSGAGLPGVPLAIVLPERRWVLLEPRRKRAAFLEEVVRDLALTNVEVLQLTAEEAADVADLRGAHSVATARAVADPRAALGLLVPLVRPGGVAVTFVGEGAALPDGAEEWEKGLAIVRVQAPPTEE